MTINPFEGMIIFCSVVEHNGFGTAARALGHAPSHISKQIALLETNLGTRLLNRTTRTFSLTHAGERYYHSAKQVIHDAKNAKNQISQDALIPAGLVKIGIPVSLSQTCINKWLGGFLTRYPEIRLQVEVSDRMADIVAEGFDLVIRVGTLPDSQHIARKLATSASRIVAAPSYLEKYGVPLKPQELSQHQIISYNMHSPITVWEFSTSNAKPTPVKLSPRVICNSAELELELAISGAGITRLPGFVCQDEIDKGKLVTVLDKYDTRVIDIHAIFASKQNLPKRVRVLIDYLAEKFSVSNPEL